MATEVLDVNPTEAPTPSRRRWLASGATIGLVTLLVAALVFAGWGALVHHDGQRTGAMQAQTQRELAHTVANVATVTATLRSQNAALSTQEGQARTDAAQLASDRSALTKAQATLFYEGVDVVQLNTCLSGVVKALNALSINDVADATSTLQSVLTSCKAANG